MGAPVVRGSQLHRNQLRSLRRHRQRPQPAHTPHPTQHGETSDTDRIDLDQAGEELRRRILRRR